MAAVLPDSPGPSPPSTPNDASEMSASEVCSLEELLITNEMVDLSPPDGDFLFGHKSRVRNITDAFKMHLGVDALRFKDRDQVQFLFGEMFHYASRHVKALRDLKQQLPVLLDIGNHCPPFDEIDPVVLRSIINTMAAARREYRRDNQSSTVKTALRKGVNQFVRKEDILGGYPVYNAPKQRPSGHNIDMEEFPNLDEVGPLRPSKSELIPQGNGTAPKKAQHLALSSEDQDLVYTFMRVRPAGHRRHVRGLPEPVLDELRRAARKSMLHARWIGNKQLEIKFENAYIFMSHDEDRSVAHDPAAIAGHSRGPPVGWSEDVWRKWLNLELRCWMYGKQK